MTMWGQPDHDICNGEGATFQADSLIWDKYLTLPHSRARPTAVQALLVRYHSHFIREIEGTQFEVDVAWLLKPSMQGRQDEVAWLRWGSMAQNIALASFSFSWSWSRSLFPFLTKNPKDQNQDMTDIYSIINHVFSDHQAISWLMADDKDQDSIATIPNENQYYSYKEVNLAHPASDIQMKPSPMSLASLTSNASSSILPSPRGSHDNLPSLVSIQQICDPTEQDLMFHLGDQYKCFATCKRNNVRVILEVENGIPGTLAIYACAKLALGASCLTCSWYSTMSSAKQLVPMTKCAILFSPWTLNQPTAADILEYSISHLRIQCEHVMDSIVKECHCEMKAIAENNNASLTNKDPWSLWLMLKNQAMLIQTNQKDNSNSSSTASIDIAEVMSYLKEIDALPMNQPERFNCKFCSTTFSRKYDLKRHVHTKHLPEKRNFACELCSSKFKRREHLDAHYAHIHQRASVKCSHCDRLLTSESNLRRHLRNIHSIEL